MLSRLPLFTAVLLLATLSAASSHFSDYAFAHRAELTAEFNTGTLFDPPPGMSKFVFSNDYPTSLSAVEPQTDLPWESLDFHTQPREYLTAALDYCFAGNLKPNGDFDFNVKDNTGQRWYHAPWLHTGVAGREPINGLTAEHAAPAGYLSPGQKRKVQSWAVGYYNELGAVTFGDVWRDPAQPQLTRQIFPNGTVAFKLLFTEATPEEVPQLKGTFEIPALIHQRIDKDNIDKEHRVTEPVTMHLIQIDIAIKDSRSEDTGWVFGTFVYDGDMPGTTWRERLVPLGLAYGNDPGYTGGGDGPAQCWINKDERAKWMNDTRTDLGYQGRLNGPLDNQVSSCISCHSTAQYPAAPLLFMDRDKVTDGRHEYSPTFAGQPESYWFRNIMAGKPFRPGDFTSDYSLQLSKGIVAYNTWLANHDAPPTAAPIDVEDTVSRDVDDAAASPCAAGGK